MEDLVNGGYGYGGKLGNLRKNEFGRLSDAKADEKGEDIYPITYLDHAGATLYGESQLRSSMTDMCKNVFANPHSQSSSSQMTSTDIENARQLILEHLNADPKKYTVIFTSGATAALKIVGECFPWRSSSEFCYTQDNHNSVLGIREYARERGCVVRVVDEEEPSKLLAELQSISEDKRLDINKQKYAVDSPESKDKHFSLFAFPAESNFSGRKIDLNLISRVKSGEIPTKWGSSEKHWLVCVDAAKFCATDALDLTKFEADFVTLSFYKIFGFPTGLGALIVRNEAGALLRKRYFGGGTVEASVSDSEFWKPRTGLSEKFEDGTVSFLSICSLKYGFRLLSRIGGIKAVRAHLKVLTAYLYSEMASMCHHNGSKVCRIYGHPDPQGHSKHELFKSAMKRENQGPIVSFNLKDSRGNWIGYSAVERVATLFRIQLRTGCFCNPGACQKHLSLTKDAVIKNLEAGHVCWDSNDIVDGNPIGSVRISLGYMTTLEEINRWLNLLKMNFIESSFKKDLTNRATPVTDDSAVVSRIILYPIKSCAGMEVDKWSLGRTGLLYDRYWAIVNSKGNVLTQKRNPKLSQIKPKIDVKKGILILEAPGECSLTISILNGEKRTGRIETMEARVCSSKCMTDLEWEGKPGEWLERVLGQKCSLVRMKETRRAKLRGKKSCEKGAELSFANEGQYLLVSESSVHDVATRFKNQPEDGKISYSRFRPNFVIRGAIAYAEDSWQALRISSNRSENCGQIQMKVIGPCVRCQMVDLHPETGDNKTKLLRMLAGFRKYKNQIVFGILLERLTNSGTNEEALIQVGDFIKPQRVSRQSKGKM
mmetsp:Transcript_28476/g.69449  ORF Transcript_28476/g.69449 Transcript_28476/m.69449 type:complete len:826 (-) Transcript_28476:134-2611(-)